LKFWFGSEQERRLGPGGWRGKPESTRVPRFYFDIHDGERFTPDDEGLVLPDAQAARDRAVSTLPDIARDVMPDGAKRDFVVTMRDESGTAIFRASLSLQTEWLTEPAA
jgi:hypothetical protein